MDVIHIWNFPPSTWYILQYEIDVCKLLSLNKRFLRQCFCAIVWRIRCTILLMWKNLPPILQFLKFSLDFPSLFFQLNNCYCSFHLFFTNLNDKTFSESIQSHLYKKATPFFPSDLLFFCFIWLQLDSLAVLLLDVSPKLYIPN